MAKHKSYLPLPKEQIICRTCAKAGNAVEMERDNLDVSYLEDRPPEEAEFRSYRCPACEDIAVFRVR